VVVQVTFNEPIDPLSVNTSTFYLVGNGTQDAVIKVSQDQRSLTPAQALTPGTFYTINVAGVSDLAGDGCKWR
jgi:Bacterial Ig-like domain